MTGNKELQRMIDSDSAVSETVRDVVSAAAEFDVSPERVENLRDRVNQAIAGPQPPATPMPPSSSWLPWKLTIGIATVVGTTIAIWFLLSGDGSHDQQEQDFQEGSSEAVADISNESFTQPTKHLNRPAKTEVRPQSSDSVETKMIETEEPEQSTAQAKTPRARQRDSRKRLKRQPSQEKLVQIAETDPPEKNESDDLDEEMLLITQAQLAIRNRPERTLELVNQHRRRFPRGIFVQEREALQIEALARLGRNNEAQNQAQRFRKNYPRSNYQVRINSALENSP